MPIDDEIFVYFETPGGSFAVSVSWVREVVDSGVIVPYPESRPGHIGIVSLRGRVFSVLQPAFVQSAGPAAQAKLMLLEFDETDSFFLQVQNIRKITVDRTEDSAVLNVQGKPVRLLNRQDFEVHE